MIKKVLIIVVLIGLAASAFVYNILFSSIANNTETQTIRIRKNWTMDSLAAQLKLKCGVKNTASFTSWAKKLRYPHTYPCFIEIEPGDGVWQIVSKLKAARYQTKNISINPEWEIGKLSKAISNKLEIDSAELANALQNDETMKTYGLNGKNWQTFVIPNTYEFFVKAELPQFLEKMHEAYTKFWNQERKQKANKQQFSPQQVATIASIVTKESHKPDEYNNIAGVYINRLNKGMRLQADPTVAFARGKGGRVRYKDLQIQNEYNTYQIDGLPPGPICIPNQQSMDAVLNYSGHTFLFFCAREDFSGYHNFATTGSEHERNATKWRIALNELQKRKKAEENK